MTSKSDSPRDRPHVLYEVGELVRVIDGPFFNFNGVIQHVDHEQGLIQVAVLIFGRSTPAEFRFDQVERAV